MGGGVAEGQSRLPTTQLLPPAHLHETDTPAPHTHPALQLPYTGACPALATHSSHSPPTVWSGPRVVAREDGGEAAAEEVKASNAAAAVAAQRRRRLRPGGAAGGIGVVFLWGLRGDERHACDLSILSHRGPPLWVGGTLGKGKGKMRSPFHFHFGQMPDTSTSPAQPAGGLRNFRHPFQERRLHLRHDAEAPPPAGAAPFAAVGATDAKARANESDDEHEHYAHRAPWLRAGVLGANDGLVSTASLMLGVGGGR
jgi:hypothetical protein